MLDLGGTFERDSYFVTLAGMKEQVALLASVLGVGSGEMLFADRYGDMSALDRVLWREWGDMRATAKRVGRGGAFAWLSEYVGGGGVEKTILEREYFLIRHKWLLKRFVDELARRPKPVVTTSPLVAFALEEYKYPEQVTIIVAGEVGRLMVALDPAKSRIDYLAIDVVGARALMAYGVAERRVAVMDVERVGLWGKALGERLAGLDAESVYARRYPKVVNALVGRGGAEFVARKRRRALTIGFVAGDSKCARDLVNVLADVSKDVRGGSVKVRCFAGDSAEVMKELRVAVNKARMGAELKRGGVSLVWDVELNASLKMWMKGAEQMDLIVDPCGAWRMASGVMDLPYVGGAEWEMVVRGGFGAWLSDVLRDGLLVANIIETKITR